MCNNYVQIFRMVSLFLIACALILSLIYIIYHVSISLYHVTTREVDNSEEDIKYVLQWRKTMSPFEFLEERNDAFIRNKCFYTNCYITDNKHYFRTIKEFDAIIYNADVFELNQNKLPKVRSPKQKYIFGAMESASRYPVNNKYFDAFFNWTWTYKLDSDFRWGYIAIYDLKGNVVGPKINMTWHKNMKQIDENIKTILSKKTKAVVWFVSNCKAQNNRGEFVDNLRRELNQFRLTIDVYGKCGSYICPKTNYTACKKLVQDKYYFYLAFENSFAEDYVTEKLTFALHTYTVPVVFGGANYSRFVPKGSYLDARELGPKNLALEMRRIISNKTIYYDFFRWTKHYKYETRGRNDVCKLCAMLNDKEKMEKITVWNNFRSWWNEKKY